MASASQLALAVSMHSHIGNGGDRNRRAVPGGNSFIMATTSCGIVSQKTHDRKQCYRDHVRVSIKVNMEARF